MLFQTFQQWTASLGKSRQQAICHFNVFDSVVHQHIGKLGKVDLVALVPASFLNAQPENQGYAVSVTTYAFELPVTTERITVSQMWHPRLEVDPVHRWLRNLVLTVCRQHVPL